MFLLSNVITDSFNAEQEPGICGVQDDIVGADSGKVQTFCIANGGPDTFWVRRYAGQSSAQVLSAEQAAIIADGTSEWGK